MKTVPFWTDDYPRPADLPVGDLRSRCDVLIIGAGITGLTAARQLARADLETVVVDAEAIGDGASAINGGIAAYGLKRGASDVIKGFGAKLGGELWEASNAAVDRIQRIATEESIECDFARPGSVQLGFTSRDDRSLAAYARWTADDLSFPIEWIARSRLSEVIGSDRFSSAVIENVSAGLHPAKYTFGLARAAARAGATLVEKAEVTGLTQNGGPTTVTTRRGQIRVDRVLVATNGETGTIFPSIRRGIVPIGSYSIVTEPVPGDLAEEILPGNRIAWTSRRFLNYFRRTPDDRILIGGRRNLRADLDLTESAGDLRSRLLEFFPQLAPYQTTHVWGGRLGATFDLLPHIGRRDGVWYAMGYGGHGLALGTQLGTEVGRLMSGELDRSPFAEIPHPNRWYYRKNTWFLPFAAVGFRILDRLGR